MYFNYNTDNLNNESDTSRDSTLGNADRTR